MYRIDRSANAISSLQERSFSSLGFRERDHLQEWIAKNPSVLGEDLLIIQKEFAGFSDTYERLDLLALDKQGALVIIENKLDDAGKDVTWQALKYASYCSGLSRDGIRTIFQEYLTKTEPGTSAEERLLEFFEVDDFQDLRLNQGVTQRIILVAARFRKEVTSTVLWLINYNVRLQCFRATVYSQGEDLFLSVDQIIPTKEAEEYMIGLAVKAQDEIVGAEAQAERHGIRLRFWTRLLAVMNEKNNTFANISPQKFNWITAGSGMRGIGLNFSATRTYGRAEIYIDRGDREENKLIFDTLYENREEIERLAGSEIGWERLDDKRGSRLKIESGEFNSFDEDKWDEMIEYMTDAMVRLERALEPQMTRIRGLVR
jgi:Predicted nuclease of the RecB family